MMTNTKKTEAEKQLIKFRNQLHNLLIKYPEIQIASDIRGDMIAWIFSKQEQSIKEIYLPTNGKQELISK
jgi:hypothetical protein